MRGKLAMHGREGKKGKAAYSGAERKTRRESLLYVQVRNGRLREKASYSGEEGKAG